MWVVCDVFEDDIIGGPLAVDETTVLLLLGRGRSLQGGACGGGSKGQHEGRGRNDKEE